VFNDATALSNSEAAAVMKIVLGERKQADPAYTANPVLQKTLEYAGELPRRARCSAQLCRRRAASGARARAERFGAARTNAAAISMRQCAARRPARAPRRARGAGLTRRRAGRWWTRSSRSLRSAAWPT